MLSLEKYDKYKENKKIQKIIDKNKHILEKRKSSIEQSMKLAMSNYQAALDIKYAKQLARIEKKRQWQLDNQVRKVLNKKGLKPKKLSDAKIKMNAYSNVQRYARALRANKDGMVILLDTGEMVHYTKAQGGHHFPKSNYPQLGFEINNIRPISAWGNKRQGDMVGTERLPRLIIAIGPEAYNEMKLLSERADLKNQIRDRSYYQAMSDKYKKLADDLEAKLKGPTQ